MLNEISRLKLELLCKGIRVSPQVLKRFPGYRYKRASLSEGLCFDLFSEDCNKPVPINLAIHEKFVKKSPFFYDEDKGFILKHDKPYIKARIIDYPGWYFNKLKDGTPFQEVFQLHYQTILATSLTNYCEFKLKGKGCKFCAIGYQVDKPVIKSIPQMMDVLRELTGMGHNFSEINLNSGTLLDEEKGVDMFLDVAREIRKVVDWPIYAQICPPKDLSFIEKLAKAGITCLSFNLEIYDKELREEIMPSKGLIPREYYFEAMEYASNVLGRGQVSSWLISGLEPVESTIEGLKRVANAGAIPFITVFRPLIGSEFEDLMPPEVDDIAPVFEVLGQTLTQMKLDPAKTLSGCVKCNCCSALWEVIL